MSSRQDYKTEAGFSTSINISKSNHGNNVSGSNNTTFLREAELNFLTKERELHEAHENRCHQMKQV